MNNAINDTIYQNAALLIYAQLMHSDLAALTQVAATAEPTQVFDRYATIAVTSVPSFFRVWNQLANSQVFLSTGTGGGGVNGIQGRRVG